MTVVFGKAGEVRLEYTLKRTGKTLEFSIESMDERFRASALKGVCYEAKNGVRINSIGYPQFISDRVYLRGNNKEVDDMVYEAKFSTA